MNKEIIQQKINKFLIKPMRQAAQEQNLQELVEKLRIISPDISDQYTLWKVDNAYYEIKVRNMHAFQMSLITPVMDEFKNPVIVDIGDSSGAHIKYLKSIYAHRDNIKCLSVNLDKTAVEKIKKKGLDAIYCRAENLEEYNIKTDVFLSFETLEHIMDPCNFLHTLSTKTKAKYFILTVPYVHRSRVGLRYIRKNMKKDFSAENTHIFELSPSDWKLLFKLSGWKVDFEQIYYQYPKFHGGLKYYWRKYDFEGFYGVRLVKDHEWSNRYLDWNDVNKETQVFSKTESI